MQTWHSRAPSIHLDIVLISSCTPPRISPFLHFFALDIEDEHISDHLGYCLALKSSLQRRNGNSRPPSMTVAFFNDDVCSESSHLQKVVEFAQAHSRQLVVEGISGIEPGSLTQQRLQQLKAAGFPLTVRRACPRPWRGY